MNEKIENLLQISMQVTEEEREKSPELRAGYDEQVKSWELIIKYAGDVQELKQRYKKVKWKQLMNQYLIAEAEASFITMLAREPLVEWIEKPKSVFFERETGMSEACISNMQAGVGRREGLSGAGILVAIIDSGIAAENMEFRKADGSTRILNIWDQTEDMEMNKAEIDKALLEKRARDIPGRDISGHGSNVAAIACGNNGVAYQAAIIVVKIGISRNHSFPRTTQLMAAIDYVMQKAITYGMPVAINLSFGNNYGSHMGNSLLERFINDSSMSWKNTVCIGSGNEGLGATHVGGVLQSNEEHTVELAISAYETALNIQIWKEYWDDVDVELVSPTGVRMRIPSVDQQIGRSIAEETRVLMFVGQPVPYSMQQEIYMDFIPQKDYLAQGIWSIKLIAGRMKSGSYDIWLPGTVSMNKGTGFLKPDNNMSCTIPGTAERAITVGAYDARTDTPAPFSGRGRIFSQHSAELKKPDIIAPGVDIQISETEYCTGTSFATPFVTGSAALLMEWGIVKGNDPFLYGEKLKAYLIKGARQLPGMANPNPMTGWGALCVRNSLPI